MMKEDSDSESTSDDSTVDITDQDQDIQYMIKETQQSRDHVVLVLSFDKLDQRYSRALKRNLEARREFPEKIRLGGYSEDEFVQLLVRMLKRRSLQVEGGFEDPSLRVLVRRVLRRHESSSTSRKLRALEFELDTVCYRCEKRQEQEYLDWARSHVPGDEVTHGRGEMNSLSRPIWARKNALIKRKDIFGPEPEDIRDESEAWREIQQLVGLESVKKHISQLFDRAKINYRREIRGLDPIPVTLNRVFVGEPGVGKTTVAKLYGEILSELDLLSRGGVGETDPSDLIAKHVGESELRTKRLLEAAMGNVLIIDDADMLYHSSGHGTSNTDGFRAGVIDTIVANVSGKPGEDRCVILIGNKDRMEQMFRNSNPGLQRRFPIEDAVHFENYNVDQLCRILDLKIAEDGNTKATEHAKRVAREVLSRASERPKFGNAGEVENLLARARLRHAERLEATGGTADACDDEAYVVTLEPEDFDPDYDRASHADQNRDYLFSGFVGFEKIVNQFRQYQLMADGMRKHQIDPRPHIPWAFIFKGPPGTGKT
jgi:DNA polymerase III delta prime subunit